MAYQSAQYEEEHGGRAHQTVDIPGSPVIDKSPDGDTKQGQREPYFNTISTFISE